MLQNIVKGIRTWTGIPSATQLIKDTRQAWLMLKHPYAQEPDEHTLALLGTAFHNTVEMDFERMTYKNLYTGLPDYYDKETGTLIDFKVSGKYKYDKKDYRDYELQLNMYRLVLEERGYAVNSMQIAFIVRDGSRSKGASTFHWVDIKRMRDEDILEYAETKNRALVDAMEDKSIPPKCPDTWGGRKCSAYCSVKQYCDKMEEVKWTAEPKDEWDMSTPKSI
jgi:hypothetical protein